MEQLSRAAAADVTATEQALREETRKATGAIVRKRRREMEDLQGEMRRQFGSRFRDIKKALDDAEKAHDDARNAT